MSTSLENGQNWKRGGSPRDLAVGWNIVTLEARNEEPCNAGWEQDSPTFQPTGRGFQKDRTIYATFPLKRVHRDGERKAEPGG